MKRNRGGIIAGRISDGIKYLTAENIDQIIDRFERGSEIDRPKNKRPCRLCVDPNRKEVHRDILSGMSANQVCLKHGGTHTNIRYHYFKHLTVFMGSYKNGGNLLDLESRMTANRRFPIGKNKKAQLRWCLVQMENIRRVLLVEMDGPIRIEGFKKGIVMDYQRSVLQMRDTVIALYEPTKEKKAAKEKEPPPPETKLDNLLTEEHLKTVEDASRRIGETQ